jgi:hypothetical protein
MFNADLPCPDRSVTPREFARRYRVGVERVRGWILRGELRAINTADHLSGKPRWVIPPEAIQEWEQRRQGGTPAEVTPRRRRRVAAMVDFYPD